MPYKIFIDGQEGTTGLKIGQYLTKRSDIQVLEIDPALRKEPAARRAMMEQADVIFLCLPDTAAIESAALAEDLPAIVIDASTAHRVDEKWVYGLPELSPGQKNAIASAKRISNCGCYATGFLAAVAPLTQRGLIPKDALLTMHAVSGYSGAGKKAIAQYEDPDHDPLLDAPRLYALPLKHKHLPEMQKYAALTNKPVMTPYICPYYAGMTVTVPLTKALVAPGVGMEQLKQALMEHYEGQPFISVAEWPQNGFISAMQNNNTNRVTVYVGGNEEQFTLISVLDNLGKGASGGAVQSMNIALGLEQTTGLL